MSNQRQDWHRELRIQAKCLAEGVRISDSARDRFTNAGTIPLSLHEYATTGGITFRTERGTYVNAPFDGPSVTAPTVLIDASKGPLVLVDDGIEMPIEPLLVPAYHGRADGSGRPLRAVAMSHADRVRLSPVFGCAYACTFCDLAGERPRFRPAEQLIEALRIAADDPHLPARHVLISGGTPAPKDQEQLLEIIAAVTRATDLPVDVMMTPRGETDAVDRLVQAGVHGFSFNLEVFDRRAAKRHTPQKYAVGLASFERWIRRAVELTGGGGRVRSLLVVGLEPLEATLSAVAWLARLGCDPVLSPFRPTPGTAAAGMPGPTADDLVSLYVAAAQELRGTAIELGPRCLPCQHNALALPPEGFRLIQSAPRRGRGERDEARRLLAEIGDHVGDRRLIWFGVRGADAEPLFALGRRLESYSLTAPLLDERADVDICLEDLSGERVDLETYLLPHDRSAAARDLKQSVVDALMSPCVVVPYRATAFMVSQLDRDGARAEFLGVHRLDEEKLDEKPWVDSCLRDRGVRTIPWRYFGPDDADTLRELVATGPIVLRESHTSGGAGVFLARSAGEAIQRLPADATSVIGVAPYLAPSTPLNLNACLFPDGTVSFHGLSVQLIGVPELTTRRFGYCGNDFAAAQKLPAAAIDAMEQMALAVGAFLREAGYLGAFGLDALWHQGELYFCEVNPRFQGSSVLSTRIDRACGRVDVYLAHMAAFLDLEPPAKSTLADLTARSAGWSQLILHADAADPVGRFATRTEASRFPGAQVDLLARGARAAQEHAALGRVFVPGAVTRAGGRLSRQARRALRGDGGVSGTEGVARHADHTRSDLAPNPGRRGERA